jgi:LuxR family transcriptional regulator, maltose regulon positive regulatory protein
MVGATGETDREGHDELDQLITRFQPRASKLRPARAQLELVQRTALVGALLRSQASLVVVSAPAGYGKSTLLAQWADAAPVPASWLQLDATDNDPVVFLSYLTAALSRVAPVDATVADLLQVRSPPIDELILPRLGDALEAAQPFLLVLDDTHLLQTEACWRYLALLFEQLPPGACLALGTRSEPPLPLARLRAEGRLADVRLGDLRLTRAEAGELLRLRGAEADDEALNGLLELTEGWATGLYLALLAGKGRPARDWLPHLRGDINVIAGYLTAEVLERQPAELQEFLLRTSILDQLCPGLCRAVTGNDDAHEHLARLARENLFVTALDDRDEWYRYHHLFAELLRAQLERREPDEAPRLHARAATWYDQHGDAGRAVRHWIAAGDVAVAAWPAFVAVQEYVDHGQVESARRLLDAFTDAELSRHLALTMAAGWLYGTVIGDPSKGERWRHAACSVAVGDECMPDDLGSWRAWQLGLRAFLAPDGVTGMLEDAESGAACEQPSFAHAVESQRVLGVATYLNGVPRRASQAFHELLRDSADPVTRSYGLAFLSLIAADEGRWDDARDLDRQALELTPGMALDLSPGMYMAMPMLLAHARVLAASLDPDWRQQVGSCEDYLANMVPQIPWRIILICVVLGEINLEHGGLDEADRWATRAEAQLRTSRDAGMLRGRVARLRQAVEELRMADPLTSAERRVLDLLPTQLSAPQIAARLFVSGNTVKTHMSHLYTKLEVTTRTGAVERARELGLLRPPDQS